MPEIEHYPVVGPDHPLNHLGIMHARTEILLLDHVADCSTAKHGTLEVLLLSGKGEPVVRSPQTGKQFHVPWNVIISMALARGINEPD